MPKIFPIFLGNSNQLQRYMFFLHTLYACVSTQLSESVTFSLFATPYWTTIIIILQLTYILVCMIPNEGGERPQDSRQLQPSKADC